MATYDPPTISNYNDNPPSNDGSTNFTDNGVDWDRHIDEIGDPLNTFAAAISSSTETAFGKIDAVIKRVEDFGADPTPGFDNKDAFEAAKVWLAAQTGPARLVFGGGRYEYSLSPNWAVADAEIVASGTVYLRYTGVANAFTLDGGAAGGGVYNMTVGKFHIECPSTGLDAVYMRAMHHCTIDMNVRGAGTASNGLEMVWCVANKMYITVSSNETGSWYSSGKPLVGIKCTRRGVGEDNSFNTFINPISEGVATGLHQEYTNGDQFYGGAFEGCTTIGLQIDADGLWSKFFGCDFEQNGPSAVGPDITCAGTGCEFFGIDVFYLITFLSTAKGCILHGGHFDDITIDASAENTMLLGVMYDRFSRGTPGVITDNGTRTVIKDAHALSAGYLNVRERAAYNADLIESTPAAGTSPWTYTNSSGVMETFAVQTDESITSVAFVRDASSSIISTTHGMWDLSPGDGITLTYPGTAPTISIYTR